MKFLGINGSGRAGGNTAVLVQGLLQGARGAGAEAEFAELAGLTLRGCSACKACKADPAKVCVIQDDMQRFYRLLPDVDVLVLASPVYLDHITAQLMAFVQRTYCYLSPSLQSYWPHAGTRFVSGITYGALGATQYDYILDWMEKRMAFYFDIPTAARLKVPACGHEPVIDANHPEVRRAAEMGAALAAP